MVDRVTEVQKRGYFSRLGGAFQGIAIGLLLFLGSFVLLYWNEGRADLSAAAENAVSIFANVEADAALEGQLVSALGTISTTDTLGDGQFLSPGPHLQVTRKVEVFAWEEKQSSTSDVKVGGSEETVTTYTYSKKWVNDAKETSSFREPQGHSNIQKTIEDTTVTAPTASIGNYDLTLDSLKLLGSKSLALTAENTNLASEPRASLDDNTIFVGRGTMSSPWVGDMRVTYSAIPSPLNDVSVIGKLQGKTIAPFFDKKGNKLYRAFQGDKDAAVATLGKEHSRLTWGLRVAGFLMMWIGLSMIFAPLSTLLDVIPLLGSIGRGAIKTVMLVVSLVLSVATIFVSKVMHNVWALMAVVLALVVVFGFMVKKKMKEAPAKPVASNATGPRA